MICLPTYYSAQQSIDLFSTENRLQFAEHLFCTHDYFRAVEEYRVVLKTVDLDTVRFKVGLGLFQLGNYRAAAETFKGLFHSVNLSDEAKLEFYRSIFFAGDMEYFRNLIPNQNYFPGNSLEYNKGIMRLNFISRLYDSTKFEAADRVFNIYPDSIKYQVKRFYERRMSPPNKDPVTAALLSAAIPGLGKIYTGEVADGITALLVTGILTFLSYDNFKADHKARGWIFAGLAALFYGGNIYGSAASAQIYNAGIRYNFEQDIKIFLETNKYFLPDQKFICD